MYPLKPLFIGVLGVYICKPIPNGAYNMSEIEKKMVEILNLMDSAIELIPDKHSDITDYENIAMVCLCNARHQVRNAIYEMQP